MSATGQPPEGAAEPEAPSAPEAGTETQAPASDGLERLYARMDQMASQQQQLADTFAQLTAPAEEEEDESLYYDDEGGLTEDGARAVLGQMVDERVEALMAPREKAHALTQRDDAYDALRDEYPELQDEQIAGPVLAAAVQWAQGHNPALIERPEFVDVIEWVYRSNKFESLSAAQAAEQPRPVVLESGSGAARQQRPQEPDWGDRIVKAAERLRPQI